VVDGLCCPTGVEADRMMFLLSHWKEPSRSPNCRVKYGMFPRNIHRDFEGNVVEAPSVRSTQIHVVHVDASTDAICEGLHFITNHSIVASFCQPPSVPKNPIPEPPPPTLPSSPFSRCPTLGLGWISSALIVGGILRTALVRDKDHGCRGQVVSIAIAMLYHPCNGI
jgi:hypothetical protein